MVHKKYTYKNGKRYGPYSYENKRVGNKIITTYLGKHHKNKFFSLDYFPLGILLFFVFIFLLFYFVGEIIFLAPELGTFYISLDKEKYLPGETLSGNINLNLKSGELLPLDSKIIIKFENIDNKFVLSELIDFNNIETNEGNFYLRDANISGFGEGYGIVGEKEVFPEISFDLLISPAKEEIPEGIEEPEEIEEEEEEPEENITLPEENITEVPAEEMPEENVTEIPEEPTEVPSEPEAPSEEETPVEETPVEETPTEEEPSEPTEQAPEESAEPSMPSEPSESEAFPEVPSEEPTEPALSPEGLVISGIVNKNNDFIYELQEGQKAEIIERSIRINGTEINDTNLLKIEIEDNKAIVSTAYSIKEQGFGEDFLGDEVLELSISLEKFELIVTNDSTLNVKLSYNEILFSDEEQVSIEKPIVEENITISNETVINETITDITIANVTKFGAILGQPVKWIKQINVSEPTNISIELPKSAKEIIIKKSKIKEEKEEEEITEIPEEVVENVTEGNITEENITITNETILNETEGEEIIEIIEENQTIGINESEVLLSPSDLESKTQEITIEVNESNVSLQIEYETPAPYALEEETRRGKNVKVIGPEDVHYENVLAFTSINERFNIKTSEKIKIYWIENNTFLPVYNVQDKNNNSLIDYIEWIVPSLSNQTFDIILITKAEHLDENRTFISDIYEQVKELDGNWSETIPENHYARVTFEQNLTKDRDITLYPRTINGIPRIEVYEVNKSELIAEFTNLKDNEYNKVLLTNLGQGNSYDNETEILTDEGWKLFSELNKEEKVATFNKKKGELEWQVPDEWQEFDNENGWLYEIELEDGSVMRVSERHKVYAKIDGNKFELIQITELYNLIQEGRNVWFLDSEGQEVRILDITKENYSGKIYDVDVDNDIVLVRRKNIICEKKDNFENVYNENKKEAFDVASKALSVMHNVLTDYNLNEENNYISLSTNNVFAENAPEALSVMQRSDEPRPDGLSGSTPGWGDSALYSNCRVVEGTPVWSGNSESYSQDTFDLKVVNGSIELEHIIDPSFFSSINVQRGTESMSVVSLNVTISPVNTSKAFVLLSTRSSSSSLRDLLVTGKLVNSTTLQLSKNDSSSPSLTIVEWQVIQGSNFNVQSGGVFAPAGSGSQIINVSLNSSVNLTESFIVVSSTGDDLARKAFWTGEFFNSTQISLRREDASITSNVVWQVIDWDGATVQNGTANPTTTKNLGVPVDLSKSFLIFSKRTSTTDPDDVMTQGYFVNQTQIAFRRFGTFGSVTVSYFVVSGEVIYVQSGKDIFTGNVARNNAIIPVNMSTTFTINSYDSNSTNFEFSRAFTTDKLSNETNIQLQKSVSGGLVNNTWFVVEIGFGFTGFKPPKDTGYPLNQWTNGANVKVSDNARASETTIGEALDTSNYSFGIPNGAIIDGIEVQIEGGDVVGGCTLPATTVTISIDLSGNTGTSYTAQKSQTDSCGTSDSILTYGSSTDTWGRTWNASEFSDVNFRARINFTAQTNGGSAKVDQILVKVYYTNPSTPSLKLNAPANDTSFPVGLVNQTLNVSISDLNTEQSVETFIYGVNSTDANNFYNYLLYKEITPTPLNKNIIYNFTTLPINPNSNSLKLLYHFLSGQS